MSRRLTAALILASYHHEQAIEEIEAWEEAIAWQDECEFEYEFGDCFSSDDLPGLHNMSDDELTDVDHDWDDLGGEAGAA